MNNLFEEKDVDIVKLSLELENAVIQHVLREDGEIYITEDDFYPYWIRILDSRGLISLSTYTYFKSTIPHQERLEFCNKINGHYFCITASLSDCGALKIDQAIPFRDGIIREHFVRMCRQFSKNIVSAINQFDEPHNKFVLQPGEMEFSS